MSANRKYGLRAVIGDGQAAFDALAQIDLVITDCDGTLLHTDKSLEPRRRGGRAPPARGGRQVHGREQPAGQGHAPYRRGVGGGPAVRVV